MAITRTRSSGRPLVCTALIVLLWGCDVQDALTPASPGGSMHPPLTGRVVDYQTHRGIPGFELRVSSIGTVVTDEEGVYSVDPTMFGTRRMDSFTITAEAAGYHPAVVVVNVDAQEISIPLLRLRRIAPTFLIGPEGGIAESGGLRVRIPPGALAATVPISVAMTNERALMVHASASFQGALDLDLRPHGTRFARPVEITIALQTQNPARARLRLISGYDEGGGGFDSIGVAVVGDDGQSASLFLETFPSNQASLVNTAHYTLPDPAYQGTADYIEERGACGSGGTFYALIVSGPVNIKVADYLAPELSSDGVRNFINNLDDPPNTGLFTVANGQPYRIVYRHYVNNYGGSQTGLYYDANNVPIMEQILFSFSRIVFEHSIESCHYQGGGG